MHINMKILIAKKRKIEEYNQLYNLIGLPIIIYLKVYIQLFYFFFLLIYLSLYCYLPTCGL